MPSAASIRFRLLSISKNEKLTFQQVAYRYFHERFLARLAQSSYRDNLLLKGGSFIYAQQGNTARPTIDIDFLGINISNDSEAIKGIVKNICHISLEDCVTFNPETIQATIITEQKEYHGTRLIIDVTFDTMRERIQLDIGFGDKITPNPIGIEYPVLLSEFQRPYIMAYTIETAIAEKLHAIYTLAAFNSRVKDYYDIYLFILNNQYAKDQVLNGISNTFETRNTEYNSQKLGKIMHQYANNPNNEKMLKIFIKKIKSDVIELKTVVELIKNKIIDQI